MTAPPITDRPGDLLMIFEAAVVEMLAIKVVQPDDREAVETVAKTTMVALDHWLALRARSKN